MNFLETLAAEWYTLQEYFVRTNLKFGQRPEGGFKGEMDVAAFNPKTGELVHIETSMDADSWQEREKRLLKKFEDADEYQGELFKFPIERTQRIALVGFSASGREGVLGGGIEVKSVPQFVHEISQELRKRHPLKAAIPETLPLLRAMQFVMHWGSGSETAVAGH